jgi:hypothetical protein
LAAWSGGRCGETWQIAHAGAQADARPGSRPRPARTASVFGKRHRLGAEFLRGVGQRAAEPIEEGVELALRPVVRAAADDRLARMKEQIENRRAAIDESGARARSCRRPSCMTAAASGPWRCAQRSTRFVVYGHGARAYQRSTMAGTRRLSAAEIGSSSTSLDPRFVASS